MNAGQNSTGVNGVPHASGSAAPYQNPAPLPPHAAATALSSMRPTPPLAAAASYNPAASSYASAVAAAVSKSYDDSDDDDDLMPWERHGWTPLEKSGKQKTPNKIRGELQRYIDACKAGK